MKKHGLAQYHGGFIPKRFNDWKYTVGTAAMAPRIEPTRVRRINDPRLSFRQTRVASSGAARKIAPTRKEVTIMRIRKAHRNIASWAFASFREMASEANRIAVWPIPRSENVVTASETLVTRAYCPIPPDLDPERAKLSWRSRFRPLRPAERPTASCLGFRGGSLGCNSRFLSSASPRSSRAGSF